MTHIGSVEAVMGARRTLMTIGALGALVAPAVTAAASQARSADVNRSARLMAQVQQLQARALLSAGVSQELVSTAWLAAGREALSPSVGGTATATATASVDGISALESLLLPAADMNGDNVDDVLDARYKPVGEDSERLALFARSGKTGAVLWTKVVAARSGHVYLPAPELVGPHGVPGVVIYDLGSSQSGNVVTFSLRMVALDDNGVKLWTHHESGTIDGSTGAEQHLPLLVAIEMFQADASDTLIARYDSPGGDNAATTLTPVRVRGQNGTVTDLGDPVTSAAGSPSIISVADLTGDALADVVLVVPGSDDGNGVYARHGVDGSALWSNTDLTLNPTASATDVGDVHASADGGPAATDVAINTGSPTSGGLGLPFPFPDPTAPGEHGEVALLDGASGTSVWTKTGDFAYPVEKAGKPLKAATGVVTTDTESDDTTTTATATLATYDDAGEQIYAATFKASTPTSADGETSALALVVTVGDFEADGSRDGLALVLVSSGENAGSSETLFHGADGAALKSGKSQPLGASTTGKGDDLVYVHTHLGVIVSVRRASDNTVLFKTKVAHTRGIKAAAAFGAPLHTSTCADVLVVGAGPKHGVVGVLTAKGALEWVVRYDPGSKDPGRRFRPATKPAIPHCS